MSALAPLIRAFEAAPAPDFLKRAAISALVEKARRDMARNPGQSDADFAQAMTNFAIAEHVEAANDQHYELPAAFFEKILGPHLKYSSCLYPSGAESLGEAEARALEETARHADLKNGQKVLELGCGWGSLSLWMARTFPNSTILSVSNSASQRAFIESRASAEGLSNLTVRTCDMNEFDAGDTLFDRVVSVEMFEHMANWRGLLSRVRRWIRPEGRLFLHVFSHKSQAYRFDAADPDDWIGQHFFTGGIMPSHGLIKEFGDLFELEADWRWNGSHYARTARDWLAKFDAAEKEIMPLLRTVYGAQAGVWKARWRLFFLATEGLFGHAEGEEWAVSHYRLLPAPKKS